MSAVECVLDCKTWLGESPVWLPKERCLYWTDVPSYAVHRWNPASGEHTMWTMPEMVISMAMRAKGGLIVAAASGIDFWDPGTDKRERIHEPEVAIPTNRSNDGKCDRKGRFWLGTMQNNLNPDGSERPITGNTGNLYRIDPDGTYHRMDGPFGICNTLAWSPDDRTMYFGDSFIGIYAYDFEPATGAIANRRIFAKTEDESLGVPDGSTIDAEGFLWNARWGGGCLLRWAPDGTIDRKVELPCTRITSAAFCGDDLDTLYVTTARHGLSNADFAEQPLAGGIFAVDTGVKGLPEVPFAG